jgi:hypothetical protein
MLRLTKTVCFALEMAHATLQNPRNKIFKSLGLNKIWDDVTKVKTEGRIVTFRIRVRDFRRVVYVKCILSKSDGSWSYGECHIEVRGTDPVSDMYYCVLMPTGEIIPYSGPRGLNWLELDEDVSADLRAVDVLMLSEFTDLTEWDLLEIFQNGCSAAAAIDKLRRVRVVLEEKNVHLSGDRLTNEQMERQVA